MPVTTDRSAMTDATRRSWVEWLLWIIRDRTLERIAARRLWEQVQVDPATGAARLRPLKARAEHLLLRQ
jgi:hypothetical protein